MLIRRENRIAEALDADFGGRPEALSLLADVMAPVRLLRYARRHVKQWMGPGHRIPQFPMGLIGGRARVFHQPIGLVGIMAPWNAPVALTFSHLASALAAGNRALIKPSELVPTVSALIAGMISSAFADTEVITVLGGIEVTRECFGLPFDHLVFTGSAAPQPWCTRCAA